MIAGRLDRVILFSRRIFPKGFESFNFNRYNINISAFLL